MLHLKNNAPIDASQEFLKVVLNPRSSLREAEWM